MKDVWNSNESLSIYEGALKKFVKKEHSFEVLKSHGPQFYTDSFKGCDQHLQKCIDLYWAYVEKHGWMFSAVPWSSTELHVPQADSTHIRSHHWWITPTNTVFHYKLYIKSPHHYTDVANTQYPVSLVLPWWELMSLSP